MTELDRVPGTDLTEAEFDEKLQDGLDQMAFEHGRMQAALEAILADPEIGVNIALYARAGLGLVVTVQFDDDA